jgi:hypothetical protein
MIGVRALNGVHTYPQFDLWQPLDPTGRYRKPLNRYAHLRAEPGPPAAPFSVRQTHNDAICVRVSPESGDLARLGVTHVMCGGGSVERLKSAPQLEPVFSYADRHVFRVQAGEAVNGAADAGD